MEDKLYTDFLYFVKSHDDLYTKYPNKFIVIQNEHVLIEDSTFEGALKRAVDSGLKVGTFIIQLCSSGEEGYTVKFHSRVKFA